MPIVDTFVGPLAVTDTGTSPEVIVLWPSLFTDHAMWRDVAPALQGLGYRTVAVDPPGHGASPGPGGTFTIAECARAVLQVLDALAIHDPVVLAGTSWGGFVAPRVALLAPQRVAAMALFNSSAERGSFVDRWRAKLLTRLLAVRSLDGVTGPLVVSGLLSRDTRTARPELGDALAATFLSWDRKAFVAAVRAVLVERDGILDTLAGVTAPTLVVSGAHDATLPSKHSARMAAALPNGRHVEVPDAAHLVPLESPARATDLLGEFLRSLPR